MTVLETARLVLRRMSADDAPFIVELLNEASFVRHIGDKGVRTREEAVQYILTGPVSSYERLGFGLYLVELKSGSGREPIGMCGLLKRESLDEADLGFAFLPQFWSKGYAFESASAVLAYARETLGLQRVLAITSDGNVASIRLLGKLGFRFVRMARLSEGQPEVGLFASSGEGPTSTPPGRSRNQVS